MHLHSVLFPAKDPLSYARMADVLSLSARENTPHRLTIHEITDSDEDVKACARNGAKATWIDNARKAKHHNRIIQEAKDGELLCLLDCDTMILGDLSEVESMDFDLAYTDRPKEHPFKLNTGVYFVRASKLTRKFCRWWTDAVLEMLGNGQKHDLWRRTYGYGGTHQAALGYMLHVAAEDVGLRITGVEQSACHLQPHQDGGYIEPLAITALPCADWNCVSHTWETAENPKVVHIMGDMRRWCFGKAQCKDANARRFVERWQEYDRRCREAAA